MAASVYGAIGEKYTALGRERGPLGAALTDEAGAPHGGRFNAFRNGFIYWHRNVGAFAVWGEIGVKWNELGRVAYGYPITDELPTPDRRGRFNHFRAVHLAGGPEASIYWTPETGAAAIYGLIRAKWAAEGWERGRLGYPTGDEIADGPYRRNTFERGFIRWSSSTGTQVVPTGLATRQGSGFSGAVVNGITASGELPNGSRREVFRDRTLFSHAELCARFMNQPGLNERLRDSFVSRIRPKLPSGFGVHSQSNHSVGATCEARAELWPRSISVMIRVPRNRMFVRVTTPDGFPGALDPNFAVTYDLVLRTTITFPETLSGNITQGPVTIEGVNVSRPQSNSITGSLLIVANDVISFLGGPDFVAALRRGGVARLTGLDTGVASLNARLAQLRSGAPAETRLELLPQNSMALVLATTRRPPPGPG
jgi:hypothetical protein